MAATDQIEEDDKGKLARITPKAVPTEIWEVILSSVANVQLPCGHWNQVEQEKFRRPPREANTYGFDPDDENNPNPLANTSRDILLNCAQVCQAFRAIALPLLWQNFNMKSIAGVQFYDTLLASTTNAEQLYGKHVKSLRFTWDCSGEVPYDTGLEPKKLGSHVAHYRPKIPLLKCAFADRRHASSVEDFDAGETSEFGSGWHAVTNGPDGHGTLSIIKTPKDLVQALVRIVSHFSGLETVEWNATVQPIPLKVAEKIEEMSGDTLHRVHIIDSTEAMPRCSHTLKRKTKHTYSVIPGLCKKLKHLRVDDYHQEASDIASEKDWLVTDADSAFGFRVLPATEPQHKDAPSARWIVEQCWKGAHLGQLQSVELAASILLSIQSTLPLWLYLNFSVSKAACQKMYGVEEVVLELALDEEQGVTMGVSPNVNEYESSRSGVRAIDNIRKAAQACDQSQDDWLKEALQNLQLDAKSKSSSSQAEMERKNEELERRMEASACTPSDDEHEQFHALRHVWEEWCATCFFVEHMLADERILQSAAKCLKK